MIKPINSENRSVEADFVISLKMYNSIYSNITTIITNTWLSLYRLYMTNNFGGQPLVIRHRINTIVGLRKVSPIYGVEIDIKHDPWEDKLYLSHDIGKYDQKTGVKPGDDFEDYIKVFKEQKNRFIIFNIKETGIERRVIDAAQFLGIENYFLLDVEIPFIYRAAFKQDSDSKKLQKQLKGRIAIRYSEAEPIEQALLFKGKFKWVWVDVNSRLPLDPETYMKLTAAGYKLALVCPERWGRPQDIPVYIAKMKHDDIKIDAVMTSQSYVKQWEQSGVLNPFYGK